jgi:hypothetical protein
MPDTLFWGRGLFGNLPNQTLRIRGACRLLACLTALAPAGLCAQTPPLLASAVQRWISGEGDVAFTQQTRYFQADGAVKEERVERYDPSLPDNRRWRLIEVDGKPATSEQRARWEARKNAKPRRRLDKSPSKYLDLEHAALIGETDQVARFRVLLRPEAQRLLEVDDIDVVLTVDKRSASIAVVGAALREPMRVLMGLARITDLDVNVRIAPVDEGPLDPAGEVESGSTARVTISRLGRPVEYNWSDFKRVAPYAGPQGPGGA